MSSYATKAELRNATGVDTSKSAAKFDLANLKAEVDKINIGKLKPVSVVKKTVYDKLVTNNINNIGASGLVLKTKYDTGKKRKENQT